jgi:hypothetical protein
MDLILIPKNYLYARLIYIQRNIYTIAPRKRLASRSKVLLQTIPGCESHCLTNGAGPVNPGRHLHVVSRVRAEFKSTRPRCAPLGDCYDSSSQYHGTIGERERGFRDGLSVRIVAGQVNSLGSHSREMLHVPAPTKDGV